MDKVVKFLMKKLLGIVVLGLLWCNLGNALPKKERDMLNLFKNAFQQEFGSCVGVDGDFKYQIFPPENNNGNENLRIIDVKLINKNKKEVHFQFRVNIKTKIFDEMPSYFAIDGEPKSLFDGSFEMMDFCEFDASWFD